MEPWATITAESVGVDPHFALFPWQQSGIDIHHREQQRTKSRVIKKHQARLHHIQKMFSDPEHDRFASTRAYNGQVKPTSEVPALPALGDCTSIAVKDLQCGTTHRRQVLRGVLVVDACFTGSVDTVLEDQAGDCVQVCVYDHPDVPTSSNFQLNLATAQKVFARGLAIAVLEPYYKLVADGSYAVRVDNPAQVIFLDNSGPLDVAGRQQEGKKHFQARDFNAAAAAYDKALHLMQQQKHTNAQQAATYCSSSGSNDGPLLLQLLLNASAACHKLQQVLQSVAYAVAAVVFSNHESNKAYYRLALAADAVAAAAAGGCDQVEANACAFRLLADAAFAFMSRSFDLTDSVKTAANRRKVFADLTTYTDSSNSSISGGSNEQELVAAWTTVCSIIAPAVFCLLQQKKKTARDMSEQQSRATAATAASSSSAITTDTGAAVPRSCSSSAAQLKECGNAAFRTADYQSALGHYQAALKHIDLQDTASQVAVLLSNKSACYLQLGGQQLLQQACLNAVAAVLLDSNNIKGWHRMVTALQQLTLLQSAVDVCRFARHMHPGDCDLQQLQRRVTLAFNIESSASSTNGTNCSDSRTSCINDNVGCSSSSSTTGQEDANSIHSIKNIRNINQHLQLARNSNNSSSSSLRHEDEPRYIFSEREVAISFA